MGWRHEKGVQDSQYITIRISRNVKKQLQQLGKAGDSLDKIIAILLGLRGDNDQT